MVFAEEIDCSCNNAAPESSTDANSEELADHDEETLELEPAQNLPRNGSLTAEARDKSNGEESTQDFNAVVEKMEINKHAAAVQLSRKPRVSRKFSKAKNGSDDLMNFKMAVAVENDAVVEKAESLNTTVGDGSSETSSPAYKKLKPNTPSSDGKLFGNVYQGEKSFVCEICGKAFRFRSNLAEHRSVHTSLKPFVCLICGKSSRLKGNLTKHILKHHMLEQGPKLENNADPFIKRGKKTVKDPAAADFLEKSMLILNNNEQHSVNLGGHLKLNNKKLAQSDGHFSPPDDDGGGSFGNSTVVSFGCSTFQQRGEDNKNEAANESLSAFQQHCTEEADLISQKQFFSDCSTDDIGPSLPAFPKGLTYRMLFGQDNQMLQKSVLANEIAVSSDDAEDVRSSTPTAIPMWALGKTYCRICHKHFRKPSNLTLHLVIKHHYLPPKQMLEAGSLNAANIDSANVNDDLLDDDHNLSKLSFLTPFSLEQQRPQPQSQPQRQPPQPQPQLQPPQLPLPAVSLPIPQLQLPLPSLSHQQQQQAQQELLTLLISRSNALFKKPALFSLGTTGAASDVIAAEATACSNSMKEVEHAIAKFKLVTNDSGDSNQIEAEYKKLETRIMNVERQMETFVNMLFAIFHMQAEMQNSFNAFKWDTMECFKKMQKSEIPRPRGRST
ncbi:Myeloid zinc finger 1 [Trichinella britovi]|uniref:Myeloid zinc finger 1 n=1 Tax=Trichinella britovi TaxID=45882 RepID=A0A0V1CM23_TRIBR|nr:Myeloid zinc finger 1 [Trichinella britovi]